jgi:hypothetical protein
MIPTSSSAWPDTRRSASLAPQRFAIESGACGVVALHRSL